MKTNVADSILVPYCLNCFQERGPLLMERICAQREQFLFSRGRQCEGGKYLLKVHPFPSVLHISGKLRMRTAEAIHVQSCLDFWSDSSTIYGLYTNLYGENNEDPGERVHRYR